MTITNVILRSEEASFIQSTIQTYNQNRGTTISLVEHNLCGTILDKVRSFIVTQIPISFEEPEVALMQYLYTKLIQMHGKPAGDLDYTYYQHYNTNTQQLVTNVLNKLGEGLASVEWVGPPYGHNS